MPMRDNVQFDIAEVLGYDQTYNWNDGSDTDSPKNLDNLFTIKVRSCSAYIDRKTFYARPLTNNSKNIPLIGELVLILKSYNQYSTNKRTRETWYYVQTLNINSSLNDNRKPGISVSRKLNTADIDPVPGRTFKFKPISPLQPYEGDQLYEGRWGNSIRFGSTISTIPEDYYHKSPTWTGDVDGDPIIILSNGHTNLSSKEFTIENIEQDKSSLYLTSTQKINEITFSTEDTPKQFNSFNGSNFIGVADRIMLRARTDRAVIDSQKDIILNTPNKVKIGSDSAVSPIPQGDQLQKVLNQIASILEGGHAVQGSISQPINQSKLATLRSEILKINSSKYTIEKN